MKKLITSIVLLFTFVNTHAQTASADLNNVSFKVVSSSTGLILVKTMDPTDDIIIDGSASTGETLYGWSVEEYDLSTSQPVAGTTYNTGWIQGEAVPMNLSYLYPYEIDHNKIYHVEFSVANSNGYDAVDLYFELINAEVEMDVNYNSIRSIAITSRSGVTEIYNIRQMCDNWIANHMYTDGTEYEMKYKIELSEVNSNNMQEVPGTLQKHGWIYYYAPSTINLKSIFNINTNKIYKVEFFVGDPEVSDVEYFEFKSCGGKRLANPNSSDSVTEKPGVNIYPNPTDGRFVVEFNEETTGTIQVINILGEELISVPIQTSKTDFDLSNMNKGVYFVRITSNGVSNTEKIIVGN